MRERRYAIIIIIIWVLCCVNVLYVQATYPNLAKRITRNQNDTSCLRFIKAIV